MRSNIAAGQDEARSRIRRLLFTLIAVPALSAVLALSGCGGDSSVSLGSSSGAGGNAGASANGNNSKGGASAAAADASAVVTQVEPAGTVTAFLRTSQPVDITFASGGEPVANLSLTSDLTSLPVGWSVSSSSLPCASVSTGAACKLELSYTPSVAAPTRSLTLDFNYVDNTGQSRTGTIALDYAPSAHDAYIVNNGDATVARCPVDSTGALAACTSLGSIGLNAPQGITLNGSTVYMPNGGSDAMTICSIATGGLSGCTGFSGGLSNPESMAVSGSNAFIVNGTGTVSRCHIGSDGTLSACATLVISGSANPHAILVDGSTLYIANYGNNSVLQCTIGGDGSLSNCADAHATGLINPVAMALDGSTLYLVNYGVAASVTRCTVGADGSLSACADSGARGVFEGLAIALIGSSAYIANNDGNSISKCAIGADGNLSGCAVVSTASSAELDSPMGILFY